MKTRRICDLCVLVAESGPEAIARFFLENL